MSDIPVLHSKFCPACDKEYQASSPAAALRLVRKHLERWREDPLHASIELMEGWDETDTSG